MSNSYAATVTRGINSTDSIAASSTVGAAYNVAYNPGPSLVYYTSTVGSGVALYATKHAFLSGSAAAAVANIDLTSIVCSDGSVGFSYVRELWIYNLHASDTLNVDLNATNTFTAAFASGTTVTLQPGGTPWGIPPIPNGTAAYAVTSTQKIVALDPGSNTVPYQIVAIGY